jgi:hypothetical protein
LIWLPLSVLRDDIAHTDEAGDKLRAQPVINFRRQPACSIFPAFVTAIRPPWS